LKKYQADKNCMVFLRVLIIVVMVVLDTVAYMYLQKFRILMYAIMGVLTVVGVFFASIYVPLYFKNISYTVSNEMLSKESGFFIRANQTMKVSSVQYMTSIYIPLFRYIGFNFIIFNALGGSMIFTFLSNGDSKEVYKTINQWIS
jgi:membrane protein YdbS with pleckstrin-like domain